MIGVAGADEGGKDRSVSGTTELLCRLQHRRIQDGREICETEDGLGLIQRLSVEQSGPIRAVIRLDGIHRMKTTGRQCLPFTLRLAFWAGLDAIDVVHSITFDGDPRTDFIAGLGLRSHVPLLDSIDNRHICFAGTAAQDGKADIWCESARYAHLNAPVQRQNAQIAAQRVEPRGEDLLLPACLGFLPTGTGQRRPLRDPQASGRPCVLD